MLGRLAAVLVACALVIGARTGLGQYPDGVVVLVPELELSDPWARDYVRILGETLATCGPSGIADDLEIAIRAGRPRLSRAVGGDAAWRRCARTTIGRFRMVRGPAVEGWTTTLLVHPHWDDGTSCGGSSP